MKPYKCRVEYLESTGTQYIDTGVNTTSDLGFDVSYKWDTINTANSRFLGVIKQDGSNYLRHHSSDSASSFAYFVSTERTIIQDVATTGFHTFKYNSVSKKFNFDETEITAASPDTFDTELDFWLFGRNSNTDSLKSYASVKIYSAKLYNSETLVRDFIPVLDNNGKPAMYDNVSGQLFYNQGTGEFTYGRQIIPVEYLESTGTQYIDTGVYPANMTSIEAEAQYTQINARQTLTGCYDGTVWNTFASTNATSSYANFFAQWASKNYYGPVEADLNKHKFVFNKTAKTFVVDSSTYTFTNDFSDVSGNTLYMFAMHNGSTIDRQAKAKIYNMKLKNNNVLVRDYIPCIDENNVGFMFDLVQGRIYDNAGTGQFKVGANVEKSGNKNFLRKKLDMFLATLKRKRPYYCEVEYIQNTGNVADVDGAYIDTGYYPKNTTKVEFMASGISADSFSTSTGTWFFGSRQAFAQSMYGSYYAPNSQQLTFNFGVNVNATNVSSSLVYGDKRKFYLDSTGLYIDGVKRVAPAAQSAFTSPATLTLFALNNNGSIISFTKYKLHYCKIWDGNTLVRDMIPVLDWNMTPCMYDKVSRRLFYNQGTGTFSYGREIHYVDYLESTGTQYIDTGMGFDANTTTKCKFAFVDQTITGAKHLIGALSTNLDARYNPLYCTSVSGVKKIRTLLNISGSESITRDFDTNIHTIEFNTYPDKKVIYDGVFEDTVESTGTSNVTINLFRRNYGSGDYYVNARMYYCQFYKQSELVRDFIPMVDENGVGALFDRVTHAIYDNAGSGAFKYPAREVEYIQSNGSQYINTGFKPNTNTRTVGKFKATSWNGSPANYIFGVFGTPSCYGFNIGSARQYFNVPWGNSIGINLNGLVPLTNTDYDFDISKTAYKVNGQSYGTLSTDTFTSTKDLYLFWSNGTSAVGMKGLIYYCQIYDNGTLTRDMTPVFQDGVAGMYDKVNNEFYPNVGTGTFVAGKIVESRWF